MLIYRSVLKEKIKLIQIFCRFIDKSDGRSVHGIFLYEITIIKVSKVWESISRNQFWQNVEKEISLKNDFFTFGIIGSDLGLHKIILKSN